jgi:SAM-dependent methyltransferase
VFARAVLHHTRDLRAACGEFLRVLKPGGQLMAVREHVISRREDLPAFLSAHPLHHLYGGENAFLLSEYIEAIRSAGFRLEHVLKPLESAINFAPHTERSLRDEVAARLARCVPGAQALLRMPGVWPLARKVIGRFDHRPGRHYSFVAVRREANP